MANYLTGASVTFMGFPSKELTSLRIHLQCRRTEFDPWVRKNPWRREWLSPPVVLPGEFHGQKVNYNLLQKKKKKRETHTERAVDHKSVKRINEESLCGLISWIH